MSTSPARQLPGFDGQWALCASTVKYENDRKCPQCQSAILTRGTIYGRCIVPACLTVVDTSRGLVYTQIAP